MLGKTARKVSLSHPFCVPHILVKNKDLRAVSPNSSRQSTGKLTNRPHFAHIQVVCTWAKTGRKGIIFHALFPNTWRTLSPDALCTRIWDTRKHPESATHFRAFPASIRELSPPKCLFFVTNARGSQWVVGILVALLIFTGGPVH